MHRLKTTLTTTLLVQFAGTCFAADVPSSDAATAFFKTYCQRCHDAQKQEGQFRLDTLRPEFVDQATAERRGEVVFRMNSGEMPPKDEPQPKADELGRVVNWISAGGDFEAEHTFWIDDATRVWKEKSNAEWTELAAGQVVQLNLTWSPEWRNRQFRASDVWIDEESRAVATERQRRIHVRYQKHRWLAGWVDDVEHLGGSKGIVTITLFGGVDSSLLEEVKSNGKPANCWMDFALAESSDFAVMTGRM